MTPSPSVGDIWEWMMGEDIILLLKLEKKYGEEYDFIGFNLTTGKEESACFNKYNAINWRFAA